MQCFCVQKQTVKLYNSVSKIYSLVTFVIGMSTGYPGPWISRDILVTGYPEVSRDQKIPGPKNPGILKPEKSPNKESREIRTNSSFVSATYIYLEIVYVKT